MDDVYFAENRTVVTVGDITEQTVDAVVNAANLTLFGGGGVDGAIHRKGGEKILAECREIRATNYPNGLPTGQAVITTGGNLKARFVIHTVGPIFGRNPEREQELLADCYFNSLKLAAEKGLQTIAFPSISTGAFGYPKHKAARVSSEAIKKFFAENSLSVSEVRLVFFSESDAKMFLKHQNF